jgi:Ion channel
VNAKTVDSMLRRSPRATPIVAACFLIAVGVDCSMSLAQPTGSARIDYGMPERLGRQVAPTPGTPWSAPGLRGYTSLLKTAEPSPIDPQKLYSLVELIYFVHYELRLGRAGVRFWRDVAIVAAVTLVALAAHLVAIATWALVFSLCGEFSQLAEAVYHSGLNYTTLGDSDAVISPSWRLLVPLEGANGMLMFGVSTAMLFAVIQRLIQTRLGEPSSYDKRVPQGRE